MLYWRSFKEVFVEMNKRNQLNMFTEGDYVLEQSMVCQIVIIEEYLHCKAYHCMGLQKDTKAYNDPIFIEALYTILSQGKNYES